MAPPNNQYAVLGNRMGFRLNYVTPAMTRLRLTQIIVRLDDQPVKVRYNSTTIRDVINDTPDTCTLTIDAATPPHTGQRLTIRLNANAPRTLFAGPLQTVDLSYEGKPVHNYYPCQAIDDTPVANRKLPYGSWVNTSATTIGIWLVTTYAPGFSSAGVQAGLPPISVNFDTTEGMDGCLRQIAKLIGGYFYWEDKVLHVFVGGEPGDTPDPVDATHPPLNTPAITVSVDTSQMRTRTYGKGYAEQVIADVAAFDAIVPISNAVMFNPAGGQAVSQTQRLRYTGTVPGGGGTVVGPGVGPSAAPILTLQVGAGVTPGLHYYAVTFQTAAGESLIGPFPSIATGALPPPATGVTAALAPGGPGPDFGGHYYAVTFVTAAGETLIGTAPTFYAQQQIAAGTTPITIQDDVTGFGNSELHPGDLIVLYYVYSSVPPNVNGSMDPPPAANGLNLTPLSPASAGYTIKPGPGGQGQGFRYTVPFSQDPNVRGIFVYLSINFQPMKLMAMGWHLGGYGYPNSPGYPSAFLSFVGGSISTIPQPTGSNPILGGVTLSQIPIGPTGTTARNIYRTLKDVPTWGLLGSLANNTGTTFADTKPDSALGAPPPTTNTAAAAQVQISGIPIGPATVTGRKLYRTGANLPQLKLLTTLGDNTTTTYLDTLADASLGANAPTGDTSGLQQPAGLVLAGAASMIVAGVAWASAGGGWAIIGNGAQTIRYTGISGNTLTGIPPIGPGAITATVSYNSTITAAAALLGVTGLVLALIKGAPINVWVQRDDLAAQSALAAADGSDGVIEHLITDERRGEQSLMQLCDADLAQYATAIQTVPYATRDPKTKSGKPVTFNLDTPSIHATLTIQDVTITEIGIVPGLNPKFTVTASSVRFSLEDILRRLGADLNVTS